MPALDLDAPAAELVRGSERASDVSLRERGALSRIAM
jgi:hypothetical protein